MMILNDEQRMLRDTIADFLAKESPVEALRALRDQEPELAWEPSLWSGLCELGAPPWPPLRLKGVSGLVKSAWERSYWRRGAPCARARYYRAPSMRKLSSGIAATAHKSSGAYPAY